MARIEIKTISQIHEMRAAGLVVAETLAAVGETVDVGVTTNELNQIGRDLIANAGGTSPFLGYGAQWGIMPFPAESCISLNDNVVHGFPSDYALQDGDLVSYDFGTTLNGWVGDAARSFIAGNADPADEELIDVTREAMWAGISAIRVGGRIGDISNAIQRSIEARGNYGILREYTGHGIGSTMHQKPDVPNAGRARSGAKIVPGMVLAIEPMVTLGTDETEIWDDDWTVVTADGSRAAHWENTVAILPDGVWILTELDGGMAEAVKRGIKLSKEATR